MIDKNIRVCSQCKKEYNNPKMTVCIKCGYPTIQKVITKGEQINADPLGERFQQTGERPGVFDTSKKFKTGTRKK